MALLLGVVFLTAQFHFCADLTSDPTASHICPFCTAAGSALVTQSPNVAIVPAEGKVESAAGVGNISAVILPSTSPRAPPYL